MTLNSRRPAHCSAADGATSAAQLLRCIEDVNRWMCSNRLKLNANKTQFIWLGAHRQLQQVNWSSMTFPWQLRTVSGTPASLLTLSCRILWTSNKVRMCTILLNCKYHPAVCTLALFQVLQVLTITSNFGVKKG